MSNWQPHITVACVIEREGDYLLVEERDKATGAMVFNQPAGHLERGETLQDAALRETLEETGWRVELTGLLGVALFVAPANGETYCRTTFVASALGHMPDVSIDPDIHCVHWLDYESIVAKSDKMRSPLVLDSIERYRRGERYPLDVIYKP